MYNIIDSITKKITLEESGILLPKETKTVKLLFHSDFDGIFSAIFAYQQLKKQGFSDKQIKLDKVQYGGYGEDSLEGKVNPEEFEKRETEKEELKAKGVNIYNLPDLPLRPKKGEALVVVDFAALPKNVVSDFISDHHVNRKGDLLKGKAGSIGRTEFDSDSEHVAISYAGNIADSTTIKAVSNIDSAKYKNLLDTLYLPTDFKNKGRMERLAIITNTLLSALIKKSPEGVNWVIRNSTPSLVNVYLKTGEAFKLNNIQVEGLKEIISPSPDWNKINELRKKLPKGFEVSVDKAKSGERKEDLGTAKDYVEKMREKGKEDLERGKSGYFTRKQREELEKSKKEKSALGREKKTDPEDVKEKREELKSKIETKEEEKKRKQGKFAPVNPLVIRQQATDLKNYPGRYTWATLSKQGKRFPFNIKRFGNMVQVSVNPDLDATQKERIDLFDDMQKVLETVKKQFMDRYNEWAFDIVTKESGGHKQITTISGLGTIGLMPKVKRDELKAIQEYEARAKKIGKKFSELMPKKAAAKERLIEIKEMSASVRESIMDEIEKEFIKIIKDKYKGMEITKPQEKTLDIGEAFRMNVYKNLQS
jgi:hypothetical protein